MIDASSTESIEESFASIGGEVGVGGDSNALIQWLSRIKEDWILLFDNADDNLVIDALGVDLCDARLAAW